MQLLDRMVDKWEEFINTPRPVIEKIGKGARKTGLFLTKLWHYLFLFRGIILSAPVATAAVILATKCNTDLPETVTVTLPGIAMRGENSLFGFLVYQTQFIPRASAVMVPLVLTAACLLLTMCSKRMLYPWLISLLTLSVPLFLLLTNGYL